MVGVNYTRHSDGAFRACAFATRYLCPYQKGDVPGHRKLRAFDEFSITSEYCAHTKDLLFLVT